MLLLSIYSDGCERTNGAFPPPTDMECELERGIIFFLFFFFHWYLLVVGKQLNEALPPPTGKDCAV